MALRDIQVTEVSGSAGSIVGFHLVNPAMGIFENLYVESDAATSYAAASVGSIGFKVEAADFNANDNFFYKCQAVRTSLGWDVRPPGLHTSGQYLEGITFQNCEAIGNSTGWNIVGDGAYTYRAPLWRWVSCHGNNSKYNIMATHVAQVMVDGLLGYLDQNDTPQAHIYLGDVEVANVTNTQNFLVDQIYGGSTTTQTTVGVVLASGTYGASVWNNFYRQTTGSVPVWMQSGSSRCSAGYSRKWVYSGAAGSMLTNDGSNNTDLGMSTGW